VKGLQIVPPKETSGAYETSPDMPKMHCVTVIVGKRAAGKSVAAINLIEKMNTISEKGGGTFKGVRLLLCENPLPPIDEAIKAAEAQLPYSNFYTEPFSAPLRQLISKQLIENDGIIINVKDQDDIDYFIDFISTFRKIEKERPLIVILEDIDSIAGESSHSTSRLLNILDGVNQIEDVVYIATTNYPEKLQDRITNRPSRFDRRYKVELPNEEIRRAYIQHKLTEEDIKNINIEEWVERTDGMSLSHLKEVVISTIVMGREFEEVMDNLEGLKRAPSVRGSGKMGFGK